MGGAESQCIPKNKPDFLGAFSLERQIKGTGFGER